jgi:hypothetical protein
MTTSTPSNVSFRDRLSRRMEVPRRVAVHPGMMLMCAIIPGIWWYSYILRDFITRSHSISCGNSSISPKSFWSPYMRASKYVLLLSRPGALVTQPHLFSVHDRPIGRKHAFLRLLRGSNNPINGSGRTFIPLPSCFITCSPLAGTMQHL